MKPQRTPIPPGWRKLRAGEWPLKTDHIEWVKAGFLSMGSRMLVLSVPVQRGEVIIRRLPKVTP